MLPKPAWPPDDVTRERYLLWRAPRIGQRNPHRMTNPVWRWIASHPEHSAHTFNRHFDGPSSLEAGPAFCCQRFGQSRTPLPDGRTLLIGGEHEDAYDPDFFIYNDVIVEHPSGERDIYGYPYDAFGPTDFHGAALVDDRVFIIGGLSYADRREPGVTPVYTLDIASLAITPVRTVGPSPGWIYKHAVERSADGQRLVLRGGTIFDRVDGREQHVANEDEWSLDLRDLRWSQTQRASFEQWVLSRADGRGHQLSLVEMLSWSMRFNAGRRSANDEALIAQLGGPPDLSLYDALYVPPTPHEALPQRDEERDIPKTHRRVVRDVVVRYIEELSVVRVIIEGALSDELVRALIDDLRAKLERFERAPFVARRLR